MNTVSSPQVPGVCDQTSGEAKPLIEKLRARAIQLRQHDINMVGDANVGPIQGFFDWQVAAELERLSAAAQPNLLGRETVRAQAIEECAKIAESFAVHESHIFDAAEVDRALSETGRSAVQDRAIARKTAAQAIAVHVRALQPSKE